MHERWKRVVIAVVLGLVVAGASALLDMELDRLGIRPAATWLDNVTVGLVAGWCAYAWASFMEERNSRAVFEQRLRHEGVLQERARLAREIHDTLAQGFAGVIINLEAQQDLLAGKPEAQRLGDRALRIGRQSLAEARSLLRGLRPPAEPGQSLCEAVQQMLEMLTGGTQVRTKCSIDPEADDLPPSTQWEVIRIIREAVHNCVKHADASELRVQLQAGNGQVRLCVEDDGRGFDPCKPREGFGLTGMRERTKNAGGLWWVYTLPSQGTQVVAVIPFAAEN